MTAPRAFISYSHDSPEHEEAILALSNRLRLEGIDCIIDQYEESPEEGWPLWCDRQVEKADFVLVVCTPTYLRRFKKEEVPGKGLGATWEGHFITNELYGGQGVNSKFIPITFSREDFAFIPRPLLGFQAYCLDEKYESLYRRLTGRPAVVKPDVGALVPMAERLPPQPKLERKEDISRLWLVRHRQIGVFTGRESVLTDLWEALKKRGVAALSGLGGMGKTQTAIEYAWRHRGDYKAVFWVDADSTETLRAGFVSVAAALKLSSAGAKDQELAVAEVQSWLMQNQDWLLILDNADELPLVKRFLPGQESGHVLLTTRERAVAALADAVPMRPMTPEDGALLLLRRTGALTKNKALADATEADRLGALQLSKELGGLPLALDQAGAFIEETPSSVRDYAGFYASERAKLLDQRGTLGEHASVAVTFSLAFQKVEAKSAAAGDLIRLCAFLAPDAIPEEIFTGGNVVGLGGNLAAAVKSKVDFAAVIRDACRFSLVERDSENRTLGLHRLVQEVVRAGFSKEDRRTWAERAVRAVNEAFPYVEFRNWALCQRLIVHCQVCAGLITEWSFDFVDAARLLNQAGYYLGNRALFAEAEPLYERSLAIKEKALGPDDPGVALSLNNLATLYKNQGKYAEAEPLYERSLAIWERALGPDHPDVATSLNNLAGLYDSQGKYAEAEPLYERSLAIREKVLGPDHPNVATSLNNLAGLYESQGKYAEAEPLYERSLAIWEKALGPEHPDVALSLNNLAVLCYSQGKYAEAEPLYERSLAIREKALGPDHPDVATSLNNLAGLYRRQGKYAEAEPLCERSLAIREKALGPDHPNVATSLENLASLYEGQGRPNEASPLRERARGIRERRGAGG